MAKEKSKIEFKRVNINLPVDLVNRVTDYGMNLGINTTSAYIVLLNQALDQKDSVNNLPIMVELYKEMQSQQANNINSQQPRKEN